MTKGLLVLLVGATLLVYLPVRNAPFVYEDETYVRPAGHAVTAAEVLGPRGLTALSFRGDALMHGRDPRAYHGMNLLLHLLAGLAVFAVAGRLLPQVYALLTAALFLLHPINSEAVAYVAGRADLIATLGVLVTVWAVSASPLTWTAGGLAVLGAVAAVGGKETGIMALPLAGLYWVVLRRPRWSWRASAAVAGGGLLVVALLLTVLGTRILGNEYMRMGERHLIGTLCLQSAALWTFVRLAIWPVGLTVDHDMERISRLGAVGALVAGVLVVLVAWRLRHTMPVVTFGVLWVVVALLPRLVVPIPELLREGQLYTPFVGLWLALSAGLMHVHLWLTATKKDLLCAEPAAVS